MHVQVPFGSEKATDNRDTHTALLPVVRSGLGPDHTAALSQIFAWMTPGKGAVALVHSTCLGAL